MSDDRVTKAIRLRALTDPLGAKGYRRTRQRVEREASARRTVFAVVLAAFLVCFGLVAGSRHGAPAAANAAAAPVVSQPSAPSNAFGQFGTRHHHRFADDNQQGLPSIFSPSAASSGGTSVPHVTTRTS